MKESEVGLALSLVQRRNKLLKCKEMLSKREVDHSDPVLFSFVQVPHKYDAGEYVTLSELLTLDRPLFQDALYQQLVIVEEALKRLGVEIQEGAIKATL